MFPTQVALFRGSVLFSFVVTAYADMRMQVLKALAAGERVVLLDERGRDISSEDMAKMIAAAGGTEGRAAVWSHGRE